MKKLILLVSIFVFVLSSYSFASQEQERAAFGSSGSAGMFCNIEGAEVCVVAQSEDDCTKLGGEKVDACPASQENE